MAVATLPVLSREYVRVPVTAEGQDVASLKTSVVEFAFEAEKVEKPADTDWVAGSWDSDDTEAVARILVGPGGAVTLAVGSYWVWVRVTGSIERPVRQAGQLKIV